MENYDQWNYPPYDPESNLGEQRKEENVIEGIRIPREPLENYQYALVGEIEELKLENIEYYSTLFKLSE